MMVASYTTTDASNLETALTTSYFPLVRPEEYMEVGFQAGLFHINTLVSEKEEGGGERIKVGMFV